MRTYAKCKRETCNVRLTLKIKEVPTIETNEVEIIVHNKVTEVMTELLLHQDLRRSRQKKGS